MMYTLNSLLTLVANPSTLGSYDKRELLKRSTGQDFQKLDAIFDTLKIINSKSGIESIVPESIFITLPFDRASQYYKLQYIKEMYEKGRYGKETNYQAWLKYIKTLEGTEFDVTTLKSVPIPLLNINFQLVMNKENSCNPEVQVKLTFRERVLLVVGKDSVVGRSLLAGVPEERKEMVLDAIEKSAFQDPLKKTSESIKNMVNTRMLGKEKDCGCSAAKDTCSCNSKTTIPSAGAMYLYGLLIDGLNFRGLGKMYVDQTLVKLKAFKEVGFFNLHKPAHTLEESKSNGILSATAIRHKTRTVWVIDIVTREAVAAIAIDDMDPITDEGYIEYGVFIHADSAKMVIIPSVLMKKFNTGKNLYSIPYLPDLVTEWVLITDPEVVFTEQKWYLDRVISLKVATTQVENEDNLIEDQFGLVAMKEVDAAISRPPAFVSVYGTYWDPTDIEVTSTYDMNGLLMNPVIISDNFNLLIDDIIKLNRGAKMNVVDPVNTPGFKFNATRLEVKFDVAPVKIVLSTNWGIGKYYLNFPATWTIVGSTPTEVLSITTVEGVISADGRFVEFDTVLFNEYLAVINAATPGTDQDAYMDLHNSMLANDLAFAPYGAGFSFRSEVNATFDFATPIVLIPLV